MADFNDSPGSSPTAGDEPVMPFTDATTPDVTPDEPVSDADPAQVPPATPVETDEERAARESEEQLLRLFQSTVFGPGDEKIGRVGQVYLDDQTQVPNWVTVKTGLFGTKEYFVPLDEATFAEKQIVVPYSKEIVTASPRTEVDQNLSPAEEDDLYNHYRVPGRMTTAENGAAPLGGLNDPAADAAADPAVTTPVADAPADGVALDEQPAEAPQQDNFFANLAEPRDADDNIDSSLFAPPGDADRIDEAAADDGFAPPEQRR